MKKLNSKQKRAGAALTIGALAASLGGGAVYAAWSDSEQAGGGTITAGNLDVALVGDETGAWQDVSADRSDSPHEIDLDTFKIVPGDTIQGTYAVDAALQGDNLVAKLGMKNAQTGTPVGNLIGDTNGVKITYSLVKADGSPVAGATDIAVGTDTNVTFAAADNSNKGDLPTLPAELDETADYNVVVKATFDANTPDQTRVKTQAALSDMTVSLDQVRSGAAGYTG